MADNNRPPPVDRRSEPRESLDTGFDPYVLSLLPVSDADAVAARAAADRHETRRPAGTKPTRHRSALIHHDAGRSNDD